MKGCDSLTDGQSPDEKNIMYTSFLPPHVPGRLLCTEKGVIIMKRKDNVRWMCFTALLGALATVLMAFEFPVPLMPPFIKFDFSDLPALIAAFACGPVSGVCVCLIKNAIHVFMSQSAGIGELANFLVGIGLVIPAGLIYKHNKTKKGAIIATLAGCVTMALFSLPANYFITYPFYQNFMPLDDIIAAYQKINPNVNGLLTCLIVFNMPFTFVKGFVCSALTVVLYGYLAPVINKGMRKKAEQG